MSRSLAAINQDRDRLRSKLHDLTAESEVLADKHKDDFQDDGVQQRVRRLTAGKENVTRDLALLDEEARDVIRARADDSRHVEDVDLDDDRPYTRAVPAGRTAGERSAALRVVEAHTRSAVLDAPSADKLDRLVRDVEGDPLAIGARYLAAVASPHYRAAFWKVLRTGPESALLDMTPQEADALRVVRRVDSERAMSLTGAAGGFAVPFELDPSILATSAGSVSPLRAISRVVSVTHDEWRGVSSGAITASYAAEATETTDNSPTLAQPTISTEKAQAFVPFSIEIGQDWTSMQDELGGLLADAKNELEGVKFTSGSGTNEPFGVLTGTTNTVNATTGQTVTAPNIYSLIEALPARYQPRASFVASGTIINKVYRLTPSGSATEPALMAASRQSILGKPLYEASDFPTTTATGIKFLLVGDFSRFVIVDRIGLQVEVLQHLVGTNHRPTGQRGLFAYWHNSSKVVDAGAFRVLLGIA